MDVLKRSSKILTRFGTGRPSLSLVAGIGRIKYPLVSSVGHHAEVQSLCFFKNRMHACTVVRSQSTQASPSTSSTISPDDEFQPLDIIRSRNTRFQRTRKKREKKEVPPPRYLKMPTNQDWPSVWPTAKTFHPASVPLPLHQGYVEPDKGMPVPNKFANLELMKIPNFLHLTPPAIQRHCEALKKFCTPWPEKLQDDYVLESLFPIEIITNDYCHSSPSIRDSKARIVTLRVKLSFFNFDEHAKDKVLRLVGERYNPKTDDLTLVTDCCPLRRQNYDYAMYLLTALCHESWNKEKWEDEKAEADMEKYVWEGSKSQEALLKVLGNEELTAKAELVEKYKDNVCAILNQGETIDTISEYEITVRKLLNLPLPESSPPNKIETGN